MKRRLWYESFTEKYIEGLPVGNGRLAAMMLGRPENLRIALNHEWMWRGENRFREYPDVSEHLTEVREALLQGDFLKGTELANKYWGGIGGISGIPNRVDPYQPAGDLWLRFHPGTVENYTRSLDLDTGLTKVNFEAECGKVAQELFVSSSDDCLVARMTSEHPADVDVVLDRKEDARCSITYENESDGLRMKGSFTDGISFEACVKIVTDGTWTIIDAETPTAPAADSDTDTAPHSDASPQAKTEPSDQNSPYLKVTGATNILLLLQIGTDAKGTDCKQEMIFPEYCFHNRDHAADSSCKNQTCANAYDKQTPETIFQTLYQNHICRFASLKGDVVLDIDVEDCDLPTDKRIALFREGGDPAMPLLYFEYGRYLMASGSSGELPINLQGKWNEDLQPPWDADYHLDINLQMCYWFVETLGMEHAAGTLFNLIEKYVPYAQVMAKHLYGCKGITMTLQTDVWGRTTPEAYGWAVWVGAAPWLAQHMFMHWRYTKDLQFLRERCYPFLKEAAAFFEDYLLEKDGELWIVPSQSPENRFEGTGNWPVSIGVNSSMDIQLITELLNNAAESAEILGVDDHKITLWRDMLTRLPKLTTDSLGRLNEWDKERVEVEPGHRHLSHLYGLYPAQLFEPDSREWKAAERSLDERLKHGGGHTGWSRSWVACLMARLGRGEDAWEHFMALISDFATISLLGLHPPRIFQIDGNMGGTACVCEMLMQSRRGLLHLLPALPSQWPKGSVRNFRAQDGVTVSFAWEKGQLTACELISSEDQTLRVVSGDREWNVMLEAGKTHAVL